jgi:hypothetical protein
MYGLPVMPTNISNEDVSLAMSTWQWSLNELSKRRACWSPLQLVMMLPSLTCFMQLSLRILYIPEIDEWVHALSSKPCFSPDAHSIAMSGPSDNMRELCNAPNSK